MSINIICYIFFTIILLVFIVNLTVLTFIADEKNQKIIQVAMNIVGCIAISVLFIVYAILTSTNKKIAKQSVPNYRPPSPPKYSPPQEVEPEEPAYSQPNKETTNVTSPLYSEVN